MADPETPPDAVEPPPSVSPPAASVALYDQIIAAITPFLAEEADAGAAAAVATVLGKSRSLVPVEPSLGLLVSMCMREDHSFGVDYDPNDIPFMIGHTQQGRRTMMQGMVKLYEEVVGTGFYKPHREDYYLGIIGLSSRDEDAAARHNFLGDHDPYAFSYVVEFDEDEGTTYVATCRHFPLLNFRSVDREKAYAGIQALVDQQVKQGVEPLMP